MAFDWFFKGDRQVYEFMVLRSVMLVFVCFSLMGLVMTEYWVFVILVLSGYVLTGGGLWHFLPLTVVRLLCSVLYISLLSSPY